MSCPFCSVDESRIAFSNDSVIAIWNRLPVSPGHLLIIPRRHALGWTNLSSLEKAAIWSAIDQGQTVISERFHPDGFSVGFDESSAAGQTAFHFHLHIIPRNEGDGAGPQGSMRHIIPGTTNYLATSQPPPAPTIFKKLVTGGDDPLLPHLLLHLDESTDCDIAVAFLLDSGARMIVAHLRDFLARGGRARILVGDYLDVTEPAALRRLNDLSGDLLVRVYEARERGFHLKTYIFQADVEGIAFVGSSNLSAPALTSSIEWNYKVISRHERAGFSEITAGFENIFNSYQAVRADEAWICRYEARRLPVDWRGAGVTEEPPAPMMVPHSIQQQALKALEETRREGYSAGLVVLATGLGKTWLAAFDSDRPQFHRVLFVAHREEILNQAIDNFRRVRPNSSIGRMIGPQRDSSADLIFASVQTLGRMEHLYTFETTYFDYIIVDEFHHAAATTYRRIIDYFEPKFLLGLTATPERMDGGDLLALCQENLVFDASVPDGISAGLLCPFQYWGVPDLVDYANIPWRNARFDPAELDAAVTTEARAQNALEQFHKHGAQRCIAFCCSQRHANFMAQFFNERGVRSVAVHAGDESAPRTTSLQHLADGTIEVIFSVDMFNEGVDVPNIDTVLMLRPTESTVIWMQQFGRGLRRAPGKPFLKVIDYVGNHRSFLMKLRSVAALVDRNAISIGALRKLLDEIKKQDLDLPEGCSVTYELESIEILESLLKPTRPEAALEAFYREFLERHGVRPTAVEAFHEGFNPRGSSERSWIGFVSRMDGLSDAESAAFTQSRAFLDAVEKVETTRSHKIAVLLALISAHAIPGEIGIDMLAEQVGRLAARYLKIRADFSVDLGDAIALRRMLVDHPIHALLEDREAGDAPLFRYENDQLSTTFEIADIKSFRDLLREILDWRLAEYLSQKGSGQMEPLQVPAGQGLQIWSRCLREAIAPAFGFTFSQAIWNAGFVVRDPEVFLLVTLAKDDMNTEHQYVDHFVSNREFAWQSQRRTKKASKHGQILSNHKAQGKRVHLFVRPTKKIGSKPALFIYCGEVDFVSWEGDAPISIKWKLREAVPPWLCDLLGVPS